MAKRSHDVAEEISAALPAPLAPRGPHVSVTNRLPPPDAAGTVVRPVIVIRNAGMMPGMDDSSSITVGKSRADLRQQQDAYRGGECG